MRIPAICPLLALLVCGVACDANRASEPAPRIRTGRVARADVEPRLILSGELWAARSEKILVPQTPLWQMPIRWMAADGAPVTAGQKVLELDHSQFTNDLEQNRIEESKVLNELMRKEADVAVHLADREFAVDRARIEYEKAKLGADLPEELVTRRLYQERQLKLVRSDTNLKKAHEDLEASRKSTAAELEQLRLSLESVRRKVERAERAIEELTLFAPGEGILLVGENPAENRKLQVGDKVWVGLAVLSIPDLESMAVEVWLSDVDEGKLTLGMRAVCVLDAYPDSEFIGRVTSISPVAKQLEPTSLRRAFRVVIELDEPDAERMRPGMSVQVRVQGPPKQDVLTVPRAALDFSGELPRARMADGSLAAVRLGTCDRMRCEVLDGLEEGQSVRIRG